MHDHLSMTRSDQTPQNLQRGSEYSPCGFTTQMCHYTVDSFEAEEEFFCAYATRYMISRVVMRAAPLGC